MSDENGTTGGIAGGADDHVGNPSFFVHFNHVLERINDVQDERTTRDAMLGLLLFVYMSTLDLERKLSYIYRATRKKLSPSTPFTQDQLELLRLIALNHEEVEGAKARAGKKGGNDADGGDRRRMLAVIEVLEKQVHEIWSEHQDGWHRYMEQITGIPLTRPVTNEREHAMRPVHARRHELEILKDIRPEVRRASDKDDEDHRMERRRHGRAAAPRRLDDNAKDDFSSNGERAIKARTQTSPR
jgi:hypothetical protein